MTHAIPAYGDGHIIPPHRTNVAPAPALGHAHQWVSTVLFSVSQASVEQAAAAWMAGAPPVGLELDHENLMSVHGPTCLKCQQALTPDNYQAPCPVRIIPMFPSN